MRVVREPITQSVTAVSFYHIISRVVAFVEEQFLHMLTYQLRLTLILFFM